MPGPSPAVYVTESPDGAPYGHCTVSSALDAVAARVARVVGNSGQMGASTEPLPPQAAVGFGPAQPSTPAVEQVRIWLLGADAVPQGAPPDDSPFSADVPFGAEPAATLSPLILIACDFSDYRCAVQRLDALVESFARRPLLTAHPETLLRARRVDLDMEAALRIRSLGGLGTAPFMVLRLDGIAFPGLKRLRPLTADEAKQAGGDGSIMSRIEQGIRSGLQGFIFEKNDEETWTAIRGAVADLLHQHWRAGDFMGVQLEDAYYVRCGLGATMTVHDVLNGDLVVAVSLAIENAIDRTKVTFVQQMQQS